MGRNRSWKYLEVRGEGVFPDDPQPLTTYLLHTLELSTDTDAIYSGFRKGTRSTIKKAGKDGIETSVGGGQEAMAEFYRLNCLTRKRHGVPPQPFSFFRNLQEHAVDAGLGMIVLASFEGRCIAAGIFLDFAGSAIYKYGASDPAYGSMGANNLILWHAIQHYARHGSRTLCFGRTSPENTGLARFKSGWGTVPSEVNYYRKELGTNTFASQGPETDSMLNRVYSRLPVPLSRRIGELLYRHMG
jgi:lipid II:glycine glycyltransferase (peptidoglycan interpeptide bridge formation enzyme)